VLSVSAMSNMSDKEIDALLDKPYDPDSVSDHWTPASAKKPAEPDLPPGWGDFTDWGAAKCPCRWCWSRSSR
jgi:hypothetical protein